MDQELTVSRPGVAKGLLSRKPARAREPAIDIGPFLRQEGRPPALETQSRAPREELIHRLRQELGFPSDPSPRAIVPGRLARQRQGRDIPTWVGSLIQRLRLPG